MEVLALRKKSKIAKQIYYCFIRSNHVTNRKKFKLEDITDSESMKLFRFQKSDILTLCRLFRLPRKIVCDNRSTVSNVEGLCILLRRMVYPNRLFDLSLLFGRSIAVLCRVINYVLSHVYDNFNYLLNKLNHKWLSPHSLGELCNAVSMKGRALENCWGFIDGTVRPICRPKQFQRQVYNGHKRIHALKYQSLVAANGLIAHLFGPIEGRRHDAFMLSESKLLDALQNKRGPNGEVLCIYGDPAYPLRPQLLGPYRGSRLSTQQTNFNKAMSGCRITVEWTFEKIITLFAFVDFKKNQKLFRQPLAKYFKVAAIFTNCHTCLYGCKTADFFGIEPPSVEDYLTR